MRWLLRHRRLAALIVASVLVAGGAGLIGWGAQASGHIAVPAPAHTFDVATIGASPVDAGPVDATPIDATPIDAAPIGAGSTSPGASSTTPAALSPAHPPSASHKPAPPPKPTNRLVIPSLRVNAVLLDESIVNNSLTIPDDVDDVGHYRAGAPLVGSVGTVLLAGHVNERGQGNGALFELARIAANAVVQTVTAAGATSTWHVTSVHEVNKAALPQDIFAAGGPRRLVVVTCGGALEPIPGDPGAFSYQDNVIVTAVPA
jgi:Sortase domain